MRILKVDNAIFTVEIADTPYKQVRGLSGRKKLSENHGMLFIFADKNYHNFWMKGMMIPLDFLWINGGKVVEITENVKPEDYQPPKSFTSKFPVDEVLEVNAGTARKLNLKVGNIIGSNIDD